MCAAHFEEYFYDDNGNLTETIDMVLGGVVLNIEKGQWDSLRCLNYKRNSDKNHIKFAVC